MTEMSSRSNRGSFSGRLRSETIKSTSSRSQAQYAPKRARGMRGQGASTPGRTFRRSRRALEDVYNEIVDPYEPGMLLKDHPPVRFSDSEPSSSESELDYGGGMDPLDEYTAYSPAQNTGSQLPQDNADLRVLLQEQQTLLRTILTKQEAMEAKQTSFEQKLSELEEKMVAQGTTTPSSSDSSPHGKKKRKRLVTRELSVSYGYLYYHVHVG